MKTIKLALLSSMALACGGNHEAGEAELTPFETDFAELEGEMPADAVLTPPPVDVEALKAASVTAAEAELLDAYFQESGMGTPTSIEGRLLQWDDTWTSADKALLRAELLTDANVVEKAYAQTGAANPFSSSAIEFFRPDTERPIWIIIQDTVPTYVFNAVRDVVAEYASLRSDDCLHSSALLVTRLSQYNATTSGTKAQSFEVLFNWVPNTSAGWPCGNSIACADYPGGQTVAVNVGGTLQNQLRLAVGDVMHFNSNSFPSTDVPKLKRLLRHEFGHTLGLGHMNGNSEFIHVPGTQSCGLCISEFESVMKVAGRDSFSADDIKTLRTLYWDDPNRANDACPYVHGFRNLAALP